MRKYQVWWSQDSKTKEIRAWFVTDMTEKEHKHEQTLREDRDRLEQIKYHDNEEVRPRVATFPVSQLYDSETQERRAVMLCNYLNKILEATDRAERDTILIDAIKGAPQPTP